MFSLDDGGATNEIDQAILYALLKGEFIVLGVILVPHFRSISSWNTGSRRQLWENMVP